MKRGQSVKIDNGESSFNDTKRKLIILLLWDFGGVQGVWLAWKQSKLKSLPGDLHPAPQLAERLQQAKK